MKTDYCPWQEAKRITAKMKKRKKKKVRKPKDLELTNCGARTYQDHDDKNILISGCYIDAPKECRKLAAWLLKAALWLEQEWK